MPKNFIAMLYKRKVNQEMNKYIKLFIPIFLKINSMKTNKTKNHAVLEREMRRIFKHICQDDDECNTTVNDAMKAFTMIRQENQQFSSTLKSFDYDS